MTYTFRKGRKDRGCSLCGSMIPAGEFFFRIDTIEYPYSSICKSCGHGNRVEAVKKALAEKLKIRSSRPAPSRVRDLSQHIIDFRSILNARGVDEKKQKEIWKKLQARFGGV